MPYGLTDDHRQILDHLKTRPDGTTAKSVARACGYAGNTPWAASRLKTLAKYSLATESPKGWWHQSASDTPPTVPASSAQRCVEDGRMFYHGLSKKMPLEYRSWLAARNRCRNPECKFFSYYGGRGIKFSPLWDDFAVFIADLGPRPTARHTLDRIDSEGNYERGNCRWATRLEQARNTKRSRNIRRSDGAVFLSIGEAAEKTNASYAAIRHCLRGNQANHAGFTWSYVGDNNAVV